MKAMNSSSWSILCALLLGLSGILAISGCDRGTSEKAGSAQEPAGQQAAGEASQAEDGEEAAGHAHDKAGETCFICDPSKRDKGRLWCKEHARYEDRCWLCHAELEDKNRLYCKEHALYEDECFLCHPELLKEKPEPAAGGEATSGKSEIEMVAMGLMCNEHGVPEAECGICHPELLGEKPTGKGLKIRLPSEKSASRAGVAAEMPEMGRMQQGIECMAELVFNQNKLAEIAPPAEGVIKAVEVDLGDRVKEGELLARIACTSIGEAQGEYLKLLTEERLQAKTLERKRALHAQRAAPEKEVQEAEAAHESATAAVQQARQQLMALGHDRQQVDALAERKGTPGMLEIRAPFEGVIIGRAATRGAMAETGKPLFTLADTQSIWAMLNIPESALPRVQAGQTVKLSVESLPGETFTGELTWLSASVDEHTRMAQGRVELANADGRLKARMFAKATIVTSDAGHALIVPRSSLQVIAGIPAVFVKYSEELYEARPVKLGAKDAGKVEILAGLKEREPVVVAGSFALKSQFLISRLGAGCCE